MILLHSVSLLHQNLLVAIILMILGFLGILLQRNRLATVFSLLIWLQGAGLILSAFGQYEGSRTMSAVFLLILFFMTILISVLTALSLFKPAPVEEGEPEIRSQAVPFREEGTQTDG